MEINKQLRIELTGQDIEKIVADHVAEKMLNMGYKMDYQRNEDGPVPDMFFRGTYVEGVEDQ